MNKNYFTILAFLVLVFSANAQTVDFTDASYLDGPLSDHPEWNTGLPEQFTIDATNDRVLGNTAYARAIYTPVYKGTDGTVITATAWMEFGDAAAGFNAGNEGDFLGVIGFKHEAFGYNNNSEAVRILSNSTTQNLFLNHLGPSGAWDDPSPTMTWDNKGEYKLTAELVIGSSAATSTFSAKLENVSTGVSTAIAVKTGIYMPLYNAIVSGDPAQGAHFYLHAQNLGNNLGPNTYFNKFVIGNASTLSTPKISNVNFSVYPNPADDILNISSLNEITSIKVTSITGKTIFSQEGGNSLDISSLSKGIYFLTVTSNDASSTKKFIKK